MKRIPRTLHAPALKRTENNERVATYSPDFQRRSTRQRHDARKTTRGSPFTPRISSTLHAPASRSAGTNERVATYVQNFKDAPRASAPTHRKQREGRHLQPKFQAGSTRWRHDAPEAARGSPLTPRISRTLHAPASRRAENNERVATCAQNFEDAPRASVTTRRNQREGCHLCPEYRGHSTRQRSNAPKTTRRSPLTAKISRTLHALASRRAASSERVATCVQNFEDAPRASVATRGKQREGRHLRPEFRGRSTRQRTTRGKQREGRHLRPEFRGRSTRWRHDAPEPARRSPLTPRISRTLHAPALQRTENNETVATYNQNFEADAPRADVTTRRKLQEGRHLRPEFRGRSTRQRHDAWKTTTGSPLTPRISRTLHAPASRRAGNSEKVATNVQNLEDVYAPASRRAENNERVATYALNFEDAPRASVTTRRKQ